MSMWTIPLFQCIGCHQGGCSGTCLATHRDRYCCHNPSCVFHAPCPAPPEPGEQGTAQAATSTDDTAEPVESTAGPAGDPNLVCRETIVREWHRGAPGTGNTNAVTASATPSTAANAGVSTSDNPPPTPPATFTIEEFEAQERLLSEYQQPQARQPRRVQLTVGTRRNEGRRGSRTRPRVRFQFD